MKILIVGAGLSGALLARKLTDKEHKCLIIEKRNHIGGNCYDEKINGINVHKYGIHIFHTNSKNVWDYINQYAHFRQYKHQVKVNYKENILSFPINLMTLYQLYGEYVPSKAESLLTTNSKRLEGMFYEGYGKKMWGKFKNDIDACKRIPVRSNFDDNYFNAVYSGIPESYTEMFDNILNGIDVILNCDFFSYILNSNLDNFDKLIYTGEIDKMFGYKYGKLPYRSLKFVTMDYDCKDYQGCAQMNFPDERIPYTRAIEHKHYNFDCKAKNTLVTFEFPCMGDVFYPINTPANNKLYREYYRLTKKEDIIYFGRLAEYKYYNMDDIVEKVMDFEL